MFINSELSLISGMETNLIDNSAFFLETLKEVYNTELERHYFRSHLMAYRIKRFGNSTLLKNFHLQEMHEANPDFLYAELDRYKNEVIDDSRFSLQERDAFKTTVESLFNPQTCKNYKFELDLFKYSPDFKKTKQYSKFKDVIKETFKEIGGEFDFEMLVEASFKKLNHEIMPPEVMKTKYKASGKLGFIVYTDTYFADKKIDLNVLCTKSALETHVLGTKLTSSTREMHFAKMAKDKKNSALSNQDNILMNLPLEAKGYKVNLSDQGKDSTLELTVKDTRLLDDPKRVAVLFELINVLKFLEDSRYSYLLNLAGKPFHRRA